jgi:hypothetical protein
MTERRPDLLPPPRPQRAVRVILQWALTLHIYLSMAGFLLILLFAVTGLTLNHANFGFSQPTIEASSLVLPAEVRDRPTQETVATELRALLDLSWPITFYQEFPDEIEVVFAAPGGRIRVVVDRGSGTAMVESETRGILGLLGDLHTGSDTGRVWFWIIDIAAILLTITSLTGIVTLASLPARRRFGFVVGAIGAAITLALYLVWTPG